MHTHALAADLRPRRSLWLSRRARWSGAVAAALAVALVLVVVLYRLNQQPYAFDRLTRVAGVGFPGAVDGPGARVFLDGGRAFVGYPTGNGGFNLRSVDVEDPAAAPAWTNATLANVDTFRVARGSVIVSGLPDLQRNRMVTLLNASNGVAFVSLQVAEGDSWTLVGRYFLRYRHDAHKLVITDVGAKDKAVTFDQPGGPGSWWLTDNWSAQQVPTAVDGTELDEPGTVDPHLVRATTGRGLEVVSLSTGKPVGAAADVAGPEDLVYAYGEQVFVAERQPGFQVRAYDRTKLGRPQWSWTAQAAPTFVTACGERRVCVGEEHNLTALDTKTGEVAYRLDVDNPAHLLPVGDRLMLRHSSAGQTAESSLVDENGRIVRSWPGRRAARLDEGSYLLLPADPPQAGAYPWFGVEAGNAATRHLGDLDVRLDTCTWSHTYVACAAPGAGQFVFYRVRSAWYSGAL